MAVGRAKEVGNAKTPTRKVVWKLSKVPYAWRI